MRVRPHATLSPAPGVLTRRVGDELVLLHLESELYFSLDPVGAAMWQAVCEEGNMSAAHAILSARYDAPTDQLRSDLEELVGRLVDNQLLSVDDA